MAGASLATRSGPWLRLPGCRGMTGRATGSAPFCPLLLRQGRPGLLCLPLGLLCVTYVEFIAEAGVKQAWTARERKRSSSSVDSRTSPPPQRGKLRPGEVKGRPARPPKWARQSLGLLRSSGTHLNDTLYSHHMALPSFWTVRVFIYTFRGHKYIQLFYPRGCLAYEKIELGNSSGFEAARCSTHKIRGGGWIVGSPCWVM